MEDMDPDPRVQKLRKLQYCVVSSTIFLLIHMQLPNFILLITVFIGMILLYWNILLTFSVLEII